MVTITATLVSAGNPSPVQIVALDMPSGEPFVIVGQSATGTWSVPGGVGVGDGSQVVLIDNRAPLNTPVTYVLTVAGETFETATVTVEFSGASVLQSLDGQTVVPVRVRDTGDQRDLATRTVAFDVPGRRRPPVRWSTAGDGGGAWLLETFGPDSGLMSELLSTGRPVVLRTSGLTPSMEPVSLAIVTGASSSIGPVGSAYGDGRRWALSYLLVGDPEPGTALSAWTWDDFDEAMSSLTWDDFDAMFATSTWNDFDTYDWGQLL